MLPAISNPTTFRRNVVVKLLPIIGDENNTTNLEKGVYNFTIKESNSKKIIKKWDNPMFVQIYIDRLRSIHSNLKNETFLNQIKSGELKLESIASMTPQEMNPARWFTLIDQKMKRDASKYSNNLVASTDMYKCRKCKSKRCTYYEMQTRSADEPTTVFVTCLDCGKHWKC